MKPKSSNNLNLNSLKDKRLKQTNRFMEAYEVDVLVVASTDSIQNRGNVRFLTNYSTVYGSSLAVLRRGEEPILIVPAGSFQEGWAECTAWTREIRAVHDFATSAVDLLKDLNKKFKTIGLVGFENLPGSVKSQITSTSPEFHYVDLSIAFGLLKALKTNQEITMARKSVKLADAVFDELLASSHIGTCEKKIFACASNVVTLEGAEDHFLLGSSSWRTVMPYPVSRTLSKGDLLRFSVEPASQGGFWTQTIRSLSVGKPSKDVQTTFNLCMEALQLASEKIKPEIIGGEVAKSMIEVLKQAEGGSIGPLGHGMGLDLTEPPYMLTTDETIIKPGMVIAVHPSLIWQGINIWIGDTFLVTETGVEKLSKNPNQLHIL